MQTQQQKFTLLQSMGFDTPRHAVLPKAAIPEYFRNVTASRPSLDFDIDGLVFSVNDLDKLEQLGFTSDRTCPKGQIALKFPAQGTIATIKAVEWSADGGAHLSPVGIIDPIELAGAIIQRVSLKSYRWMTSRAARLEQYRAEARKAGMNPIDAESFAQAAAGSSETVGIGSVIEVVRSGDVIPKIDAVVANLLGDCQLPEACPCCGSAVAPNGAYLDCQNVSCEGKSANQMRRFLTVVGVKGLGQATLVEYAEAGITLIDFFQQDDFAGIEAKLAAAGTISMAVWAKIKAQLLAAQAA